MSKPRLGIIIASVRASRVGDKVGEWIAYQARNHDGFDVDVIDLAEVALPLTTDEPEHPATGKYQQETTKAWSKRIDACDAFILVTPEYNHGYPASLKNALDLVNQEWAYKPVGFASYGGVSGGLRAVTALKPTVLCLRMIPALPAFVAPFVPKQIQNEKFSPTDEQYEGTKAMLDELLKLTDATASLRSRPEAAEDAQS